MRRRKTAINREFPERDYRKERGWDIAAIYSRGARRTMAADIRSFRKALRKGRSKFEVSAGGYLTATMRSARVSTATRNFLKRR
jgi:hypothetical protein